MVCVADAHLCVVHLYPSRCESPLPHDLHQRQVQPEYWPTGVFLGHLGPPGDHVRHAGSGEVTSRHKHTLCYMCAILTEVCVCVCDAARVRDLAFSEHREELLSA